MIVGIGIDLVDVPRFETKLSTIGERVFTTAELQARPESLAGYWAAKEAVIKAIGNPEGFNFQEVEVVKDEHGKPHIQVAGKTKELTEAMGISKWHLSISHDGQMAIAMVIAEN